MLTDSLSGPDTSPKATNAKVHGTILADKKADQKTRAASRAKAISFGLSQGDADVLYGKAPKK